MHANRLIASLDHFGKALPVLLDGVSEADARWKPPPPENAWSILEVVRHLIDEEVEDFRARLELTLRDPDIEWPKIDPERAAVERRYNDADFQQSIQQFATERAKSIAWLKSLRNPDWSKTYKHPKRDCPAGVLLASWAAHDHLHLKQIAKRKFQLAARDGGEYEVDYAGQWGP